MNHYIGRRILRDEDNRFLRGLGEYTDDVELNNVAYAVFVRSPYAHANILGIDYQAAHGMPGVLCILDAERWQAAGLGTTLPPAVPVEYNDGRATNDAPRPVFAETKVCHVGDPVAVVVADTQQQAIEAAECVVVDYEPLPAVVDVCRALEADMPIIHPSIGTNEALVRYDGDPEATEKAIESAAHVSSIDIRCTRVTGNSIEPRAYTGHYARRAGRYTLWTSSQLAHGLRRWLCEHTFRCPIRDIRVIAPDVGGAFGTKAYFYPEQPVVMFASKLVGRPVRFTATRSESLQTDAHARDFFTRATIGLDERGKILGLRMRTVAGFGAYQSTFNAVIAGLRFSTLITNLYAIPAAYAHVTCVYTNTAMVDAYRGVGEPPITVCERLLDKAAKEIGMDPLAIRAVNYIAKDEFPYASPVNEVLDSGDPLGQQQLLEKISDLTTLRDRYVTQAHERLGIGVSAFVDRAGMGPSRSLGNQPPQSASTGTWEAARIEIQEDTQVVLSVGTHSHGQGHDVTFRQIVADVLHLPIESITLTQGDTDRDPGNFGTGAMRSLTHAGMALHVAGERLVAKAKRLAAHLLEAADVDIEYADGQFQIAGTDRGMSFQNVARMAYSGADYPIEGFDLGLDQTIRYDVQGDTFPTGMQLAVVVVDTETGVISLRDYWVVNDCGVCVNPMIVEGQIHGGLAQGIGQALFEEIYYDEEGQLLTGSFMDYVMPKADCLPHFHVSHQETPTPVNPLGVKGVGEMGVNGAPSAIGNALMNALHEFGVTHLDPPYTPMKVWQVLHRTSNEGVE